MDRTDAETIANAILGEFSRECGQPLVLLPEHTEDVRNGWVFFFQSEDYVRTGDSSLMLVGNGPIHVQLDGTARQLGTALPWESQVER